MKLRDVCRRRAGDRKRDNLNHGPSFGHVTINQWRCAALMWCSGSSQYSFCYNGFHDQLTLLVLSDCSQFSKHFRRKSNQSFSGNAVRWYKQDIWHTTEVDVELFGRLEPTQRLERLSSQAQVRRENKEESVPTTFSHPQIIHISGKTPSMENDHYKRRKNRYHNVAILFTSIIHIPSLLYISSHQPIFRRSSLL